MQAALDAGDDDEAERLHARYIELGTVLRGPARRGVAGVIDALVAARRRVRRARAAADARRSRCSRSRRAAPTRPCSCTRSCGSDTTCRCCTWRTRCAASRASPTRRSSRALADELELPYRAWTRRSTTVRTSSAGRATSVAPRPTRRAGGRPIATGHTRDDRVETILYRLASSPGPRGVSRAAAERRRWSRAAAARARPRRGARGARGGRHPVARRRTRTTIAGSRATACASTCCPRFAASIRPPTRTSCAPPRSSPTRRPCSTRRPGRCSSRTARRSTPARPRRRRAELARAALRRLAGPPSPPAACLERALELCHRRAGTRRVPLGGGRVAERRYGLVRICTDAPRGRAAGRPRRSASRVARRSARSRSAARAVEEGLDPALAVGAQVRAGSAGASTSTVAAPRSHACCSRRACRSRCARSTRWSRPTAGSSAFPGVAVAAHARARPGLELAVESP